MTHDCKVFVDMIVSGLFHIHNLHLFFSPRVICRGKAQKPQAATAAAAAVRVEAEAKCRDLSKRIDSTGPRTVETSK